MADLAAGDRRDDLVLLGIRIERSVVQNVLGADFLRDRAALFACLAQDALRFENAFACLVRLYICIPFNELMPASIGDDDAAHARALLAARLCVQPTPGFARWQ